MFSDESERFLRKKKTKCVQGGEAAKRNNKKKSNKAKCQIFSQSLPARMIPAAEVENTASVC
jgi:hypothetical protein